MGDDEKMIGHQRGILAALGIDIWIPRDEACQQHQVSIWRDQATPELHSEIILPQTARHEPLPQEIVPVPVRIVELDEVKEVVEAPVTAAPVQEERQIQHIPPFSLQALNLPHCVIVMNATEMTEETQHLWSNIQRAMQGEFYELNWPFPWANMQDGRGVESYIQGFLDMMSMEKNIIFLGSVPYVHPVKMIQLASLQEMLEQPILKKRLWQFMQNKPDSVD